MTRTFEVARGDYGRGRWCVTDVTYFDRATGRGLVDLGQFTKRKPAFECARGWAERTDGIAYVVKGMARKVIADHTRQPTRCIECGQEH